MKVRDMRPSRESMARETCGRSATSVAWSVAYHVPKSTPEAAPRAAYTMARKSSERLAS